MPFTVKWLVPDRIILSVHYGVMSAEENTRYIDESMALRDEANARGGVGAPLIHTLTDSRHLVRSEANLKEMQAAMKTLRIQKVGWSVYVNPRPVDRFFVSVFHQIAGIRHFITGSMDDAVRFLVENDSTLPPLTVAEIDAVVNPIVNAQSEKP
jgi:hypothetical protein